MRSANKVCLQICGPLSLSPYAVVRMPRALRAHKKPLIGIQLMFLLIPPPFSRFYTRSRFWLDTFLAKRFATVYRTAVLYFLQYFLLGCVSFLLGKEGGGGGRGGKKSRIYHVSLSPAPASSKDIHHTRPTGKNNKSYKIVDTLISRQFCQR